MAASPKTSIKRWNLHIYMFFKNTVFKTLRQMKGYKGNPGSSFEDHRQRIGEDSWLKSSVNFMTVFREMVQV